MKLTLQKREAGKKGTLSRIRADGDIPAVLYSQKGTTETVRVSGKDYHSAVRVMDQGHLSTTVFEAELDGSKFSAIVKDVHYHPTTYQVLHIDLMKIEAEQEVNVNVPVVCTGVAECAGIKLGGFLRQVRRQIPVRVPANKIPKHFEIDIKNLGMKQSLKTKHISMEKHIRCLFPMEEVVVTIAKR